MAKEHEFYAYVPNRAICIVAAILFGGSAAFHTYQMIRTRTWYHSSLVVGSWMMTIGYAARYLSTGDTTNMMLYILQTLFVILPPSLYAATIYMIYKRLCLFVNNPSASPINPQKITKIFVTGDIFAFLLQAGGGGLMPQASTAALGEKVMLIGLAVQLLFFALFLYVSLVFYHRMRSTPSWYTIPTHGKYSWKALLYWLFIAAGVIIARCIFRIIEFAQGHGGYLISHEVFLYLFDTAPMLLVQVGFSFVYAGDVLPVGAARDRAGMRKLGGESGNSSDVEIGLRDRS